MKKRAEKRRRKDALGFREEGGRGERRDGWMSGRGKREMKVEVKREREGWVVGWLVGL